MTRLKYLMTLLWIALGSVAFAGDRLVVVELYTSQGCSSCPPADKFFHDSLAGRDDIVALALHVDYWDYLGWKDSFASPENTERQRDYARAAGHRSVYTPQMIIGGRDHVVGNHPYEVKDLIKAHKKSQSPVTVSIRRDGKRFLISASASGKVEPMVIHLVRYRPAETVDVRRGENAGRKLTYSNIVHSWEEVADWDGSSPLQLRAPARGDLPAVAIVQTEGHGPILAAARVN